MPQFLQVLWENFRSIQLGPIQSDFFAPNAKHGFLEIRCLYSFPNSHKCIYFYNNNLVHSKLKIYHNILASLGNAWKLYWFEVWGKEMEGRSSGTPSDLIVLCICMQVVYSNERSQKSYVMKQLLFRFCRWKKWGSESSNYFSWSHTFRTEKYLRI